MSFIEFIEMNGYASYIWGSYGIGLATFIGLFVMVKMQRKKLVTQLRRRYKLKALQKNSQKKVN